MKPDWRLGVDGDAPGRFKSCYTSASWAYSFNPAMRLTLAVCAYRVARGFNRGAAFSVLMAACMAVAGRTPRYRIGDVSRT